MYSKIIWFLCWSRFWNKSWVELFELFLFSHVDTLLTFYAGLFRSCIEFPRKKGARLLSVFKKYFLIFSFLEIMMIGRTENRITWKIVWNRILFKYGSSIRRSVRYRMSKTLILIIRMAMTLSVFGEYPRSSLKLKKHFWKCVAYSH